MTAGNGNGRVGPAVVRNSEHCGNQENTPAGQPAQGASRWRVMCTKSTDEIVPWGESYASFSEARVIVERFAELGCSGVFVKEITS